MVSALPTNPTNLYSEQSQTVHLAAPSIDAGPIFLPTRIITPPRWVAKILKIPVFRLALGKDLVSRIVIWIYNFFAKICPGQNRGFRNFDPNIAQRSVDRFLALGAQTQWAFPRDGGQIQMMTFRAQDLEQKIQALGGSWEQILLNGRVVYAISPPQNRSREWANLQEQLSHFHWREEEGKLITCDSADMIPEHAPTQCFLFAHSTSSSFASDWQRAGYYIGAKQDLCFFDNGNTWRNTERPISEESFYLEIEAVYNNISSRYAPEDFWVGGSCGGAPVAAYLKRRLHNQGVNFFVEQSFPDLDDFVKPISSWFAPLIKGSLGSRDLSEQMEDRPPACQFGAAKLWEGLPRYEGAQGGKVILVQVREDEHISEAAYARYLRLAERVSSHVSHILYTSTAHWRHADDFFRYEAPRRNFLQAVFAP